MTTILARDLPLADLDILGAENEVDSVFAGGVLAEAATRVLDEGEAQDDASELEDFQLHELARPARNLVQLAHKLAAAQRLGEWALNPTRATYDHALSRLLASALADVISLRQAELCRRELLAEAEPPAPAQEAQARDLAARVAALEAERAASAS